METKYAEWSEPQLIEQIAARVCGPDSATIAATIEEVRVEAMASAGLVDQPPPSEPGDMLRASDGRAVHLPPSAVRYTTARHLQRELAIVEWATSTGDTSHRAVVVDPRSVDGLDTTQTAAITAMLAEPRPVITVADTLHKLVHEHSEPAAGRGPVGVAWNLPVGSVVIIGDRTNSKQLYVGTTRGRSANHIHTAPPAFDPDQHGRATSLGEWTPHGAVAAALARQPDEVSALERRRQLRELTRPTDLERGEGVSDTPIDGRSSHAMNERAAAAVRRLQQFTRRTSSGIER